MVIDCRYSELDFIKNNILHSRLNEIFDLNKIDWLKCEEFTLNNRAKEACNLWNKGIKDKEKISRILKVHKSTVHKYLKIGNNLGWCNYTFNESRKVICLNTNKVFESINKATIFYNIKNHGSSITRCCKGIQESAGNDPTTREPLKWMYYNNYIKQKKNIVYKKC